MKGEGVLSGVILESGRREIVMVLNCKNSTEVVRQHFRIIIEKVKIIKTTLDKGKKTVLRNICV